MTDNEIIALYLKRDEQAIFHTNEKYGGFCYKISYNILGNAQDSQECVNDTYIKTWNSIPPHEPSVLSAFLAKITRALSISRLRQITAKKRDSRLVVSFDEIAAVIMPNGDTAELAEVRAEIEKLGIPVKEYTAGDDAERDEALNSIENIAGPVKSQKKWVPDMPKSDLEHIRRVAKRELSVTDNYIDSITKWMYNKIGDKNYFALYSTEDTNDPTILYASLNMRAVYDYDFIKYYNDFVQEMDGVDYVGRAKNLDEIFSFYKRTNGLYAPDSRYDVGGKDNSETIQVYIGKSRFRLSSALRNCLQDCFERRNSELLSEGRRLSTFKFQHKSLDALSDEELLARHLEENSEAVGEILSRTADIEINPRVLNLLVNKKLKEYGISKEGREQVASVVPLLMDSAKINAVKGGDITADLISGKAVEVHFGMLSLTDEAIIFKA